LLSLATIAHIEFSLFTSPLQLRRMLGLLDSKL
jgi:hypothetical protein